MYYQQYLLELCIGIILESLLTWLQSVVEAINIIQFEMLGS